MNDTLPLVSVLLSVYNDERYIYESVKSILDQTYSNFEFIIIDDFSSDGSLKIIEKFQDKRIKYIRNSENLGLTKSLNKGIAECNGKYIVRMDSDDICEKNRLMRLVAFMEENPHISVCGSDIRLFGELNVLSRKSKRYPKVHNDIYIFSFFSNPMAHSSVIFNYGILKNNLVYDENFAKAQDYVLWGTLLAKGFKFANIPQLLLHYRVSENQISIKNKDLQIITSDFVRTNLLKYQFNNCSEGEIKIHNRICNFGICNSLEELIQRKAWLKKINSELVLKFPENRKMVRYLISYYWFISCFSMKGNSHLKYFLRSPSMFRLSVIFRKDFLVYLYSRYIR